MALTHIRNSSISVLITIFAIYFTPFLHTAIVYHIFWCLLLQLIYLYCFLPIKRNDHFFNYNYKIQISSWTNSILIVHVDSFHTQVVPWDQEIDPGRSETYQ